MQPGGSKSLRPSTSAARHSMAATLEPDLLALLRGLARPDADPQALRDFYQGALVVRATATAMVCMTSAPPFRTARTCWRFSEGLSRPERDIPPYWRMRWETGTSR